MVHAARDRDAIGEANESISIDHEKRRVVLRNDTPFRISEMKLAARLDQGKMPSWAYADAILSIELTKAAVRMSLTLA